MHTRNLTIAVAITGLAGMAHAAENTVATFDGGSNDGFSGNALFEPTGGNPGGVARTDGQINFTSLRTGGVGEPSNAGFLGDYSGFTNVSFSVDVKTNSLTDFIGNQSFRPIGVRLINRDIQGDSGPAGVYFQLGTLSVFDNPEWTTLSVLIEDPTSTTLPAGWAGFGSEDPNTFAPQLPAGSTFADILANVTEFQISGAVPGFFFGPVFADYSIDNISVTVPAPAGVGALALGVLGASRRRR